MKMRQRLYKPDHSVDYVNKGSSSVSKLYESLEKKKKKKNKQTCYTKLSANSALSSSDLRDHHAVEKADE